MIARLLKPAGSAWRRPGRPHWLALAIVAGCSSADPSDTTGIRLSATAPVFAFEGSILRISGQVLQAGTPVANAAVTATTAGGNGPGIPVTVTSDGQGLFTFDWNLGLGTGRRTLTLRHATLQAQVETSAIDSASGDHLLVESSAPRVVVWAFDTANTLINRQLHDGPAGVVRLLPGGGAPVEWIYTTATGYAPELKLVRWSDAVDSVRVAPRPIVVVPVTVWLAVADTATERVQSEVNLADANLILGEAGVRLEWSDADIRTTEAPGLYERDVVPCALGGAPVAPRRLNVYYVRTLGSYGGYACGWAVMIKASSGRGPLVAHEIAHEFALGHQGPDGNVMTLPPGRRFTVGQVFRAHFHLGSGLVTRHRTDPTQPALDCDRLRPGSTRATRCPPLDYEWPTR